MPFGIAGDAIDRKSRLARWRPENVAGHRIRAATFDAVRSVARQHLTVPAFRLVWSVVSLANSYMRINRQAIGNYKLM